MSMYEEALEFATEKHKGQTRWDGGAYIKHPIRVAYKFTDDVKKTVAVIHDVVEDTGTPLQEIKDRFGAQVAKSVDSLSRRPGETYKAFVLRAVKDPIAKEVKIADIDDNMGDVPVNDEKMKEKATNLKNKRYIPALLFLQGKNEEY